ncbi:hypothetical protein Pla110_36660 [Polystyrenella longa]|uniref:Uncharacterized protein n=1 Tax=Polystyrenella longa TaxID=2528007 RepID=A0A518CRS1_9PLAN|nr:hypothetical protein [Polystyrenella longa]QDU81915.1 hypothetical protein Pla110_36660 [Polystyrenella longa]
MASAPTNSMIPLQALTVTQSIDTGMLVVRTHFAAVYKVVIPFAILACTLVYCLNHYFNFYSATLFPIVFLMLAPLGDLLIRKVTKREWLLPGTITSQGKEILKLESTTRVILRGFGRQLLLLLLTLLLIIPGLLYFRKSYFHAERKYLDNPDSKIQQRVWKELTKAEAVSLEGAVIALASFWVLLSLLLFLFVDLASSLLFDFPIFFYRFQEDASLLYLLIYDPYVMVTATAVVLFTYPIIRMAWMFCYINLRVKFDCWDIATSINRQAEILRVSMED